MLIICLNEETSMEADTTMTDDIQQKTPTGFGERLKNAREALHLTEKEAAARLHLNPNIIQILESESFKDAPPVTFMRGYLKSYARLLNFTEQEISVASDNLGLNIQPSCGTVSPLLNTNNLYKSDRYVHWITYLVVSVLLVMMGIWWNSHSRFNLQNSFAHNLLTQQAAPQTGQPTTTTVAAAPAAITTTPTGQQTTVAPAAAAPASPATVTATNQNLNPAVNTTATVPAAPTAHINPQVTTPPANEPVRTASSDQPPASTNAIATANNPTKQKKIHSDDDDDNMSMVLPEPGLEPN